MIESQAQAYWYSEYQEYKNFCVRSSANNNYRRYAKRKYHKARRNRDKQLIEEQVCDLVEQENILNDIFNTNINTFNYL